MKVRRARCLHEWMAEAGRSVRSIAFDMILGVQKELKVKTEMQNIMETLDPCSPKE